MHSKASVVILLCLRMCALCDVITTLRFHRGGYQLTSEGVSGSVVTARARYLFNITDVNLRNGVEALTGSRPDRVYMSASELENSIGGVGAEWNQTWQQLSPLRHTLTNISRTTTVMDSMHYVNNGTGALNIATTFNPYVINKYTHKWRNASFRNDWLFTFYSISDVNGGITYGTTWGTDTCDTFSRTLSHNVFAAQVGAGEQLRAHLLRHNNVMQLHITYKLSLSGDVLAHWSHDGRHVAYDANDVLAAGGFNTEQTDEEVVLYELINEEWSQ